MLVGSNTLFILIMTGLNKTQYYCTYVIVLGLIKFYYKLSISVSEISKISTLYCIRPHTRCLFSGSYVIWVPMYLTEQHRIYHILL